jgi:hypothetical protein
VNCYAGVSQQVARLSRARASRNIEVESTSEVSYTRNVRATSALSCQRAEIVLGDEFDELF